MSQYEAKSLADIAEMFERFASTARTQGEKSRTLKGRQFEYGRATAWDDAAQMLRKTTLSEAAK
jgi:hypothetical protein